MRSYFLGLFCILHVASAMSMVKVVEAAPLEKFQPKNRNVKTGLNNFAAIDAFTKTYATYWDYVAGDIVAFNCTDKTFCDTYAGSLGPTGILGYYDVDFQNGARGIQMFLSQEKDGDVGYYENIGRIYLHLDDINADPFASVIIGDTDGYENWVPVNQFIGIIPTGIHDLYFTFTSDYGSIHIGNIASFIFFKVG